MDINDKYSILLYAVKCTGCMYQCGADVCASTESAEAIMIENPRLSHAKTFWGAQLVCCPGD